MTFKCGLTLLPDILGNLQQDCEFGLEWRAPCFLPCDLDFSFVTCNSVRYITGITLWSHLFPQQPFEDINFKTNQKNSVKIQYMIAVKTVSWDSSLRNQHLCSGVYLIFFQSTLFLLTPVLKICVRTSFCVWVNNVCMCSCVCVHKHVPMEAEVDTRCPFPLLFSVA